MSQPAACQMADSVEVPSIGFTWRSDPIETSRAGGTGGHPEVSCAAPEDTDFELSRGESGESELTQRTASEPPNPPGAASGRRRPLGTRGRRTSL